MALCASRRLGFVVMPLATLALAAVSGVAAAAEPTPNPGPASATITVAQCNQGFGYATKDHGTLRCQFGKHNGQLVAMPEGADRQKMPASHLFIG